MSEKFKLKLDDGSTASVEEATKKAGETFGESIARQTSPVKMAMMQAMALDKALNEFPDLKKGILKTLRKDPFSEEGDAHAVVSACAAAFSMGFASGADAGFESGFASGTALGNCSKPGGCVCDEPCEACVKKALRTTADFLGAGKKADSEVADAMREKRESVVQ